ncbi:MAG: SDR family NAD(P)-dependent oxidoreductase [Caulobacteraceae bacterium]
MGVLLGKIALVTGAASGIGRACGKALAREGARVFAGDIDQVGSVETCEQISAEGGVATPLLFDVADEDAWRGAMGEIAEASGALHILVNNAGICIQRPLLEMELAAWRRQNSVNLDGVFLGTKAAIPLIAKSGGGAIVNMSSVAGLQGVAGLAGYCASKGAVRLFSKAAALECAAARNQIRVNSVHPGSIETPIWAKLGNGGEMPADKNSTEQIMRGMREMSEQITPLGRAGTPEDIAAGVVFLCSDAARFVTGAELVIDGGVFAS